MPSLQCSDCIERTNRGQRACSRCSVATSVPPAPFLENNNRDETLLVLTPFGTVMVSAHGSNRVGSSGLDWLNLAVFKEGLGIVRPKRKRNKRNTRQDEEGADEEEQEEKERANQKKNEEQRQVLQGGPERGATGPLGGGCSCDTPATHSELRNEPRQGCS